jgi:hypothetical protein
MSNNTNSSFETAQVRLLRIRAQTLMVRSALFARVSNHEARGPSFEMRRTIDYSTGKSVRLCVGFRKNISVFQKILLAA